MRKLGSVNPCGMLDLYSKRGKYLGYCLDTPNCFAAAIKMNDKISYGMTVYSGWKSERLNRKDFEDRCWFVDLEYFKPYIHWA